MLEVGKLLWRDGTACVIVRRDADSALVRFIGMMICDHHIFRARLEPRPNHRYARQGRRHPLRDQLRHLSAAPRQHRRRAACRRPARGADDAVNREHAPSARGTRPRPRRRRPAATSAASRAQKQGGARTPLAPRHAPCLQLKRADLPPSLHPEPPRKQGKPGKSRRLRRKNPTKAVKIIRHTQRPHTPVAMKIGPDPLKI